MTTWATNKNNYKHLYLLGGWVVYFIFYVLTEHLIPESACHVVHSKIDDMIPFCEYFVLAYVFWYLLVAGSLLSFMKSDVDSFIKLQVFITITQIVAMIVYIVWPSVQYSRPSEFERNNFCTWILTIIYGADTPTGVCPSLHVGYSIGIASTWLKKKDAPVGLKIFIVAAVAVICVSILFVKQHSFVDIVAAIPMCILAEYLTFHCKPLNNWLNKNFK